jgi:hypothetical protein
VIQAGGDVDLDKNVIEGTLGVYGLDSDKDIVEGTLGVEGLDLLKPSKKFEGCYFSSVRC